MFAAIPGKLREYRQWVCWRLVERPGQKPTKQPLNARTGQLASVTNPADWSSFEEACAYADQCSGIGFCFSEQDPFCGIDLDDTLGDNEALEVQKKIWSEFASYSEHSPSGNGLHIIIKAKLPGQGRRRSAIEIYDNARFFTMTGRVFSGSTIEDRQHLAEQLYAQMGKPPALATLGEDKPQTISDEDLQARAAAAANGDKFQSLFNGDWRGLGYPSQSEADFALVDIIAFYTDNHEQIRRLYRQSALGQAPKDNWKHRGDRRQYVDYMMAKAFDRRLPPIDIDGLRIKNERFYAGLPPEGDIGGEEGKPSGKPSSPNDAQAPASRAIADEALERSHQGASSGDTGCIFPPGLVGEVAQFIFDSSVKQVREIAYAGAIGFLAGLCGRAYNINGTGLNQYVLMIAGTGRGKEGIAHGISKLVKCVAETVPSIKDFEGPGEIASPQALIKWLAKSPCIYSIVGEFGLKLREMSNERAPPHVTGVKRALLDLFHKSAHGSILPAMAYSKREDNVAAINAPSFTLIGESTPERFFENINEDVVADGLLPRFLLIEYQGDAVAPNEGHVKIMPPINLIENLGSLVAQCLAIANKGTVCNVDMTAGARKVFNDFEAFARNSINNRDPETGKRLPTKPNHVVIELWNRAHLKALRLAALYAVGVNYVHPCVDEAQAKAATSEIFWQTKALIDRFARGDVGGGAINAPANEEKQTQVMCHRIYKMAMGEATNGQYKISEEMQRDKVFPYNLLNQTLRVYPCFKNDRRGASEAIKKIYQQLIDNDDLQEIPKPQMQKQYGRMMRAFMISNPERFYNAGKGN